MSFAVPSFGTGLPFAGLGGLAHQISADTVGAFFGGLVGFVARLDRETVFRLWQAVSVSSAPVLSGSGFGHELQTMSILAGEVVLPLLLVAVVQAVVRQDLGGLARTAFVKVPLALLFTAAAAEIVSLGLRATDQACAALLQEAGRPLEKLFAQIDLALSIGQGGALTASFLFLVVAGLLAFLVWLELAVRGAAVAVAVLFLPLALAGSALPATSHWARRLGETLVALVLSKLAIVAVLCLAVSTLGSGSGASALTEGLSLLALSALAPLALARMLPMVEAGATAHLEGLGRRAARSAAATAGGSEGWVASALATRRVSPGSLSKQPLSTQPSPPPAGGSPPAPTQKMPLPPRARPLE
jgi:hypothetical protein